MITARVLAKLVMSSGRNVDVWMRLETALRSAVNAHDSSQMGSRKRKPVGGTIVVDVTSLQEHQACVASPDTYRPEACGWCGHHSLHVHDYRQRQLRLADGTVERVRLVRFACSDCGAVWRVVPKFICARLQTTWNTVQRVVDDTSEEKATRVPARTAQRWRARFASSARLLVVLLASSMGTWAERTAIAAGLNGTHADLLAAFVSETGCSGHDAFAELAAALGRFRAGTCLMSPTGYSPRSLSESATPPEMAPSKLQRNSLHSTQQRRRSAPLAESHF